MPQDGPDREADPTIARVLVIAGSDSGGGAGIQADIKTVTMLGGHATTAITAVTAQNTLGVQAVHAVPTDIVLAQIEAVASDIGVDAVKIGMIGSAATANGVAEVLEGLRNATRRPSGTAAFPTHSPRERELSGRVPIVFDPVMVATSGSVLADAATIDAFARLMALATLVTPNLPELAALGGEAAVRAFGPAVLVKGGHGRGDTVVDRLIEADGTEHLFENPRIDTRHTHGTGCTLASAITTGLAQGMALDAAIARGIAFVRAALAHAPGIGKGCGPMGHALATTPFDQCRD